MKRRLPRSQRGPKTALLMVEWVDSCTTRGWIDPHSISKHAKSCFSVGWVIHEDDTVVSLAASAGLNDEDGFDSVDGHMTIPKVAIIRTKTLATSRL